MCLRVTRRRSWPTSGSRTIERMRLLYVKAKVKENREFKCDHNKERGYKLCSMREKEFFFFNLVLLSSDALLSCPAFHLTAVSQVFK